MIPTIHELPHYLEFADTRTIFGIPNFWNVVSNLPFLFVAVWGVRAFRSKTSFAESWERAAYAVVLSGTVLTTFGSAYFHWDPTPATLFWDRLPMTLIFMGVVAGILGRRSLLLPLILAGVASVLWWRWTGNLFFYVLVQYVPGILIPLILLFRRPRYTATAWLWAMIALYVLAKLLELADRPLGGGHAWKHFAAAAAMLCYCLYVAKARKSFSSTGERCVSAPAAS